MLSYGDARRHLKSVEMRRKVEEKAKKDGLRNEQGRIHDNPFADGWAGAVMIWAGAVMLWAGAFSNTNFPTLKMPKNAKKAKCDGPTDGPTDRPTDTVTYRLRARDKKRTWIHLLFFIRKQFIRTSRLKSPKK